MKRSIFTLLVMLISCMAMAQKVAEISFDKTTHDFGSFPESSPVVSCVFKFENVGNAPLIINQVVATCGCTVPTFPKDPIFPGKTGEIKVVYNGKGKFAGAFTKVVTVRSNSDNHVTRLTIKGNMTSEKKKEKTNDNQK